MVRNKVKVKKQKKREAAFGVSHLGYRINMVDPVKDNSFLL